MYKMGAPVFSPMTLTLIIVFVLAVVTLAIVLPLVLEPSSGEQKKPGYVPLLAPGHSGRY
jgi:hypothetical protein